MRTPLIPDAKLPAVKKAYEAGASIDEVAERFNVSFPTARKALTRAGAKLRPRKKRTAGGRQRRFENHSEAQERAIYLPSSHDAIKERRTLFPNRAIGALDPDRILKSGVNSRKIGARVAKGMWWGMPIYTLTLEERKTCPSTCHHWHSCMGNQMQWSERIEPGTVLETRLEYELWLLSRRHPAGFVVRLHVLGDFYGLDYVLQWVDWLRRFRALHVFGYTARQPGTEVGDALRAAVDAYWPRFAIRLSVPGERPDIDWPQAVTAWTAPNGPQMGNAIVCPAQTEKTDCCATCGLCWATKKPIAFLMH